MRACTTKLPEEKAVLMRKPLMATLAVLVTVAVAGSGIAFASSSTRHHPHRHPHPHPTPSPTASRVGIHDCENGFDIDQDATVEDSYIHNLYNSAESHTDGIQFAQGHYQIVNGKYARDASGKPVLLHDAANITVRHNTIYSYNTTDHQDGTSA